MGHKSKRTYDKVFEDRKNMLEDLILHNDLYVPMKTKELAILLQVPKEDRHELQAVLDSLVAEGRIGVSKKGKYSKPENTAIIGIYQKTSRGFGFVVVEGREDDIFIKESDDGGAFHMDKVMVAITAEKHGDKRCEGKIIKILEHQIKEVVGTYQKSKTFGFVVPDNKKICYDIFVPQEKSMGAVTGHKVVVELTSYGTLKKNPEGRVKEIIGHINDPGTDIMSIIKAYDLPMEFPESVMKSLNDIPDELSPKDYAGRVDLRDLQTVTIDGEDAKDLDDAITVSEENGIYHLGVHIADVSNYVKEYSPLDKEAYKRGTSVYLVDRVIPMLPHKLSNGICSLNQGCDRLALSCLMDIDEKGNVISHKICESVINVDRRMTYTNVKKILENEDEEILNEYKDFADMFRLMEKLALILRQRRFKRGSIDFDFPETKITLNDKGEPVEIKPYDRNTATRIIEDFMLIANETVAEDYFWQEIPFLYRSHENPDPEKIRRLGTFINNFGYTIKTGAEDEIHPKELQKLISKVEGTPEEGLISRLTLRSMKQAKYTTGCEGHFGLAMKYYCHFTSPIRRYPDLQIHRIIKENLHGALTDKRISHYEQILPEVTAEASRLERRADDAEREVEKMKKAEYMEQFIGETFDGVISGVTSWGMYVELPNTIEGMVRVADIPGDYYYFEEERYQMVGEKTGKIYKLGQKVRVTVSAVDKLLRTIDFELNEEDENEHGEETDRK